VAVGEAALGVGLGEFGLQSDGRREVGDCLLVVQETVLAAPAIVVDLGKLRYEPDGGIVICNCCLTVALLLEGVAAIVVGDRRLVACEVADIERARVEANGLVVVLALCSGETRLDIIDAVRLCRRRNGNGQHGREPDARHGCCPPIPVHPVARLDRRASMRILRRAWIGPPEAASALRVPDLPKAAPGRSPNALRRPPTCRK
jgi:hypothetical protein